MIIFKTIASFFFDTTLGKTVGLFSLIAGLVIGFAVDQRSVGIAKMESANAKSVALAGEARNSSRRDNNPRRVLDPYIRPE